jgi:hypothetical protein
VLRELNRMRLESRTSSLDTDFIGSGNLAPPAVHEIVGVQVYLLTGPHAGWSLLNRYSLKVFAAVSAGKAFDFDFPLIGVALKAAKEGTRFLPFSASCEMRI